MNRTKHSRTWNSEQEYNSFVEPFIENGYASDSYIVNVIDVMIDNRGILCVDGFFDCKKAATAIRRLFNALHESNEYRIEWAFDEMMEGIENGTFEENLMKDCGYSYGIEFYDESIYVYINTKRNQWEQDGTQDGTQEYDSS